MTDLHTWLREFGLEPLASVLANNDVDLEILTYLTEADPAAVRPCRQTCGVWLGGMCNGGGSRPGYLKPRSRSAWVWIAPYVSGLELGQRNPTIATLWHLAEALGVQLRHFFEEKGISLGYRRKLLKAISALRETAHSAISATAGP
jgi:Helix-turn-helix